MKEKLSSSGLASVVRRFQTGVRATITDAPLAGRVLLLCSMRGNHKYFARRQELIDAKRQEKLLGLAQRWDGEKEGPEYETAQAAARRVTDLEVSAASQNAAIGTLLLGWPDWREPTDSLEELRDAGFVFEDDGLLVERDENGDLHHDNALLLMRIPVIDDFVATAVDAMAKEEHEEEEEAAGK